MITLDEGLANKSVEVSEMEQAQVTQLCIENKSDKPLFLQVGDVVKGGQQDRTIQASVVIPPHSGKIDVPSLCVESGRWQGGQQFAYAAENGVPDKNMRMAVNSGQQGAVWTGVANYKANVNIQYNTSGGVVRASKTSSLNEEMEDPKIKAACAEYEKAFADILNQYPDAVGLAYVLNGEINTIDIFQTNSLFRKTSARLVKAYANESVLNQAKGSAKTVTPDDITTFMAQMEKGTGQEQQIRDNEVIRLENDAGMAAELKDKSGKSVHRQYIKK
jgi:nucleoside phosphorylase